MNERNWAREELTGLRLGDARREARAVKVLDQLGARPEASLPEATGTRADLRAAYALFNHEQVTPERLLQSHADSTLLRIMQQPVVLLVQDTTEIDLSSQSQRIDGLGPLSGEHSAGLFVHPLLAVTPERVPLGLVNAHLWTRDPEQRGQKHRRQQRPFDEKESSRWRSGYERAAEVARLASDTQVICVSDAEADIYECFVAAADKDASPVKWITRAGQERALKDDLLLLRQKVAASPELDAFTLPLQATPKRQARDARLSVRAQRVTLRPPHRRDGKLPEVALNAVLVQEQDRPDEDAIEWLLLTDLPIENGHQARQIIDYYTCRWAIEVYFRTLKTGCGVEQLQLQTIDRIETCLALYMIVAWRVLHVMHLGREQPDCPCTVVFTPDEWKPVWKVVRREDPPAEPPTLGIFIRVLATLGGYQNRRRDPPPGPKALWIALSRQQDLATGWRLFGPDSNTYG